jgi:prepilin-type N-terminal cleavage/methylation domain-containing protein
MRKTHGFTLVELLVVIAIIAMLVTLLLPAVQSAREAARRSQCQNNLKQLALACINFEAATGHYPQSSTPGPCCGTPSFESWSIVALPFMEEQALYDQYNLKAPNEDPSNAFVRESHVATHVCPSDEQTDNRDYPESGNGAGLLYARGSYRGNSGRSDGATENWWDAQQNIRAGGVFTSPKGWKGPLTTYCGTLEQRAMTGQTSWCESSGVLAPTKLRELEDGSSKTLLVGEQTSKGSSASSIRRRTFWAYTYTSYNKSEVVPQTRTMLSDYQRCVDIGGPGTDNPCKRAWGTAHVAGIQFAFCDGSVHNVTVEIDMELFAALASVGGPDLTPASYVFNSDATNANYAALTADLDPVAALRSN